MTAVPLDSDVSCVIVCDKNPPRPRTLGFNSVLASSACDAFALGAANDGIAVLSRHADRWRFENANPTFVRMTGYSVLELLETPHDQLDARSFDSGDAVDVLTPHFISAQSRRRLRIRRKDGSVAIVEAHTHSDGVRAAVYFRDPSTSLAQEALQLETQARLVKTQTRLSELYLARESFFRSMHHHLRTPIQTTLSALEVLEVKGFAEADEETYTLIGRSLSQLHQLLDDVFVISEIALDSRSHAPTVEDVVGLANLSLESVAGLLDTKKVVATAAWAGEPTRSSLDADAFCRVIRLLVLDAIDRAPQSSSIRLLAQKKAHELVIEISYQVEKEFPGQPDTLVGTAHSVPSDITRASYLVRFLVKALNATLTKSEQDARPSLTLSIPIAD